MVSARGGTWSLGLFIFPSPVGMGGPGIQPGAVALLTEEACGRRRAWSFVIQRWAEPKCSPLAQVDMRET